MQHVGFTKTPEKIFGVHSRQLLVSIQKKEEGVHTGKVLITPSRDGTLAKDSTGLMYDCPTFGIIEMKKGAKRCVAITDELYISIARATNETFALALVRYSGNAAHGVVHKFENCSYWRMERWGNLKDGLAQWYFKYTELKADFSEANHEQLLHDESETKITELGAVLKENA